MLEGILVSTRADTEYATQSLDITDGIARSELLVECLIRLYYLRHSYEAWDNMLIQFFASVGSKNLVKVQSSESHFVEHRTAMSSVLLCSKGMFQQSKHIYLSEVLFRLHRHAMGRELSYLLQHFGDDTGEDEQSSQRVLAMSQHVRSAWPLDDLGAAMKSTMSDVDELIVAATVSDLPASCEQ